MSSPTKTVQLESTLTYDSLRKHDKAQVLGSLLKKYRNEHNTNIIEEATDNVDDMVYVPSQFKLWTGRFVRYLDASNPLCLKFSKGGFVVKDNTYTVLLKTDNGLYRVGKRSRFFFMSLANVDRTRLYLEKLSS
jgi:hypothetical protein